MTISSKVLAALPLLLPPSSFLRQGACACPCVLGSGALSGFDPACMAIFDFSHCDRNGECHNDAGCQDHHDITCVIHLDFKGMWVNNCPNQGKVVLTASVGSTVIATATGLGAHLDVQAQPACGQVVTFSIAWFDASESQIASYTRTGACEPGGGCP